MPPSRRHAGCREFTRITATVTCVSSVLAAFTSRRSPSTTKGRAGTSGDTQVCLPFNGWLGKNGQLIAIGHKLDLNAATFHVKAAPGVLRHRRQVVVRAAALAGRRQAPAHCRQRAAAAARTVLLHKRLETVGLPEQLRRVDLYRTLAASRSCRWGDLRPPVRIASLRRSRVCAGRPRRELTAAGGPLTQARISSAVILPLSEPTVAARVKKPGPVPAGSKRNSRGQAGVVPASRVARHRLR